MQNKKTLTLLSIGFVLIVWGYIISPSSVQAQCVAGIPANLTATPGTERGTVVLKWNPATSANRYALVFGLNSGNYAMGALHVDGGSVPAYLVTNLAPGVRYFFQVWAFCEDSGPATPSNETSVVAPIGISTTQIPFIPRRTASAM